MGIGTPFGSSATHRCERIGPLSESRPVQVGRTRPRYARQQHARGLMRAAHRRDFSDPCSSMSLRFQFEREDGALFSEATRSHASLMGLEYNTGTLPISQCLFFRGENDAWAKTATRGVIKADGDQVTFRIAHPDRIIGTPPGIYPMFHAKRHPMKRPLRLVSG